MVSKGDKKKENEMNKEIKQNLLLDIETLEKKIFMEQEREVRAQKELADLIKNTHDELKKIETLKMNEGYKINNENENMKEKIYSLTSQVEELERRIRERDDEIKSLEKLITDREEVYRKELEEKDVSINSQKTTFEEMSHRFQHILQKTANKLQERVNIGV
jgi:hypothetical protein